MKRNRSGQWPKGVSGNPDGRPRRDALERVPPATPQIRHDGYVNPVSGHGTSRDRRTHTTFLPDIVSDDLARNLRRSNFLAAKIIEAESEEAYRRSWKLKLKDQKIADDVMAWAEDVELEDRMVEARQKEREAGGAAIFPVIEGAQGDLALPLNWDAIETVRAFHVLEPRELTPLAFYPSLADRAFRRPSLYMFTPIHSGYTGLVGYQAIHASRLVIFPGIRVSPQTEPGQRLGWGDSALCRPSQVLADFGLTWGSAATLLHEHGAGMLEMDGYADLMATADGEEQVWRRVGMLRAAMTAIRAGVIDGKDKFTRQAGTLSGLAEALNEFKILMSAASDGMPVSVMFGQSQTGLRTGDDDTRTWYSHVEKRRAKQIKPRHEMCLRFRFRSADGETGGKEPDVWSVEFPSLWSPSDKEVAETRKLDMETFKMAIEAGVLSADDVAESLYGQDTYSNQIKVNWKRRREQQKIAEVAAAELQAAEIEAMGRKGEVVEREAPADDEEDRDGTTVQ